MLRFSCLTLKFDILLTNKIYQKLFIIANIIETKAKKNSDKLFLQSSRVFESFKFC